jgi:hypothetical protein
MYIIYKLIISSNGLFYRVMKYFASGIATNNLSRLMLELGA